ncbi:putative adipose-regulatory protein-domain-containing protein [Gymnopilus junonius]|uniref:Adipose-regulatory protein-domain-containing protein n=1 Tax=Gymnopilus junonius TaxID=109634 RepID=A0A9P5TUK5_GYMJU|nr:putative adipose-regulatory protein-domain-containing protein [Gymnopilus junonius]
MLPRISTGSTSVLSRIFAALRPFAPRLVPLLVVSLFIPLVLVLSTAAGWVVWSNLSVSWQVPLYLQYGDGIPPYAFVSLPSLSPRQRYDISLDLVLPYTESNIALGNFMTSLTLSTATNKTLVHVRRPAITLPPSSRFFFSTPMSSRISVPLLESFIAGKTSLTASIRLGREDGWKTLGAGQGREVSVTSAYLQGLVVPHGIRGLAIRFPLLSAIASAGMFFLILSLILGSCLLPLLLPTPQEDNENGESLVGLKRRTSSTSSKPPSLPSDKDTPRRRRSRGSRERSIKTEASVETAPAKEEDPARGLRRRSSKPAIDEEK